MLTKLRALNPNLPFYSVQDPAFRRFGRVVDFPAPKWLAVCQEAAVMPPSGTRYVPSMPELEEMTEEFCAAKHALRGEGSCQVGCCWGYNRFLNGLEYHRSSEHNIAVSDLVLLLADQRDLVGNDLPQGSVTAFYVPQGSVVELYATTLHFCPCQVRDDGFRCIVILPRGTNQPLEAPRMNHGEGRLLWAQDKWLVVHPLNQSALSKGAYAGIRGENVQVRYEEEK